MLPAKLYLLLDADGTLVFPDQSFLLEQAGNHGASLGCVHLDPAGLYGDWPGVHLPDISHLPRWLARYEAEPEKFELWPAGPGS